MDEKHSFGIFIINNPAKFESESIASTFFIITFADDISTIQDDELLLVMKFSECNSKQPKCVSNPFVDERNSIHGDGRMARQRSSVRRNRPA